MWAVWALMWLSGAWSIMSALGLPDPTTEQEVSVTVEGVEGDTAAVPCDLFPTDPKDRVNLILWYKDEDKDPIYSYDARMAVFTSERHHLKDLSLKGRVSFTPSPGEPIPHTLTLSRLVASDAGRYTCRVDFMLAQSTTRAAQLRVVAPVDLLIITDGMGHPVPPVLPPIPEGGTLNITCTARGGRPSPKVSWWFGDAVIDDSWESVAAGVVSNTLVLTPLTRAQAHSVLTCKAATAPVAVTTATVTIDMYLRPVSVTITGPAAIGSVRAGDMLDLTCTARGSRPQPIITWYKGATLIRTENTNTKDAVTGVGGVSHVRVKVDRRDNGARITCRATNPDLPRHNIHEHIVINVTCDTPFTRGIVELLRMVVAQLGRQKLEWSIRSTLTSGSWFLPHEQLTLPETSPRLASDMLTHPVRTPNPPPHPVAFMHEDTEVRQDKAAGVMINGNNLVLSKVRKTQAGHYYCKATNSEGNGVSPPVNITVRYAPVCAEAKDVWAEPGNTVSARCRVNASPEDSISFSWVWVTNSYTRRVIPSHITSEGLRVHGGVHGAAGQHHGAGIQQQDGRFAVLGRELRGSPGHALHRRRQEAEGGAGTSRPLW
ncbi:nephrin-like [Penaeus chinensis]|uniref:nephrin-like n=1 Tax=Penaeus chinensis TaxID=139456 RepID=UPI001FB629D4|nr:nephrin-like [Penaeus chinensis]